MQWRTVCGITMLLGLLGAVTALTLNSQSNSDSMLSAFDLNSIPAADRACLLPGGKVDLQCLLAIDPDVKRIRAEEAHLEEQALAAAESGKLDPVHEIRTLGKIEIFDPNLAVNSNL